MNDTLTDEDCDCKALDQWRNMARIFGACCVVLLVGVVLMGWSINRKNEAIVELQGYMAERDRELIDRLKITPADVLVRVEKLESELEITPRDVFAALKELRADLVRGGIIKE